MRQLAVLLLLALATDAAANGRPAGTSTINFRLGNEQDIAAGMTFGMVRSHDGGQTWHWMCEDAIKYGGMYDPDYAYTSDGSLFATTFDGSLVNRDGCTFVATPFGAKFVSSVTRGPDNALYMGLVHPADATMSDPGDAKIYKSTDNGVTFPASAEPAAVGIWWSSIEVAPSDAQRVYLSGYRLSGGDRIFELYRSTDGGTSYAPMTLTGLTYSRNSTIEIVGVSALDPDHLYTRITFQNEAAISDALFRSTDAGQTWTEILARPADLAFVVRANGDLVAGSKDAELLVSRSPSNGAAWESIANPPHINCLVENTAGEVWACTQNFGIPGVPTDNAGIMKSTDLATWTPVLRFQDLQGPVDCPAGTLQRDRCQGDGTPLAQWCALRAQFGITGNPTSCAAVVDGPPPDGTTVTPPKPGCCESSAGGSPGSLAVGALVGMLVLRRRRRAR